MTSWHKNASAPKYKATQCIDHSLQRQQVLPCEWAKIPKITTNQWCFWKFPGKLLSITNLIWISASQLRQVKTPMLPWQQGHYNFFFIISITFIYIFGFSLTHFLQLFCNHLSVIVSEWLILNYSQFTSIICSV